MKLTGDICTHGVRFVRRDVLGFSGKLMSRATLMDYYGSRPFADSWYQTDFLASRDVTNAWAAKEWARGNPIAPETSLIMHCRSMCSIRERLLHGEHRGVVYGVERVRWIMIRNPGWILLPAHTAEQTRLPGVVVHQWYRYIEFVGEKRNVAPRYSYNDMNRLAAQAPVGSARN